MERLKKFFPISFSYTENGTALAIGIVLYLIIGFLFSILIAVSGVLASVIPVVGNLVAIILSVISGIVEAYVVGGIVIQVLVYCKVIKKK